MAGGVVGEWLRGSGFGYWGNGIPRLVYFAAVSTFLKICISGGSFE
jgi:hypothetical protein